MIKLTINEGIATVVFDRPDAMNALNSEVIDALSKAIETIESDNSVKVVVFTGAGKAFIAGADIKEMECLRGDEIRNFSKKGRDLFRKIEMLTIPTIAAINGYAFGGGVEFALSCTLRIASEKAKFGLPEATLGIIPGFSGTQRLPRVVGKSYALYLMLTGATIDAQAALDHNLVTEIHTSEELMDATILLAKRIAKSSKQAVEKILTAVNLGMEAPIDSALEIETGLMANAFGTKDQIEGMAAFREKRKPNFE
ncbi:MAG: crotonase [Eubacteriaceae bacterium]|jgi:enoyl-CoA hydratase|nr:crotonase [Eubacteriaceae bacterium]